jgi:hypothetical protein
VNREPTVDQTKAQLAQLVRARFDIKCADAMAIELEALHDDISPRAWGLLAGMAVSYGRPFTRSTLFGTIPRRWRTFPGRPDLAEIHKRLLEKRHQLLAHNDETEHRATVIFGRDVFGVRPSVTEARSPVDVEGVGNVRALFAFQLDRLELGGGQLLDRLVKLGAVPPGQVIEF